MEDKLLKEILEELKAIHFHLDELSILYKFVNRVEMKKDKITEKLVDNSK